MQKLIFLAAFAAYCVAAPTISQEDIKLPQIPLQRPSPINPDVISDPKPYEQITMITDPQEVAKHKREIEQTVYEPALTHLLPTISPQQQQHISDAIANGKQHSDENENNSKSEEDNQHQHHRQKREQKKSFVAENKPTAVKPVEKVPVDSKPTPTQRTRKPRPKTGASITTTSPAPQKKVVPVPETKKQRLRRDVSQATAVPAPLIFRDEHKVPYEGASQAAYIKHEIPHSIPPAALAESQSVAPLKVHIPENVKPQTLPALLPAVDETHALQADTHPVVLPSTSPATDHHGISNFAAALGHVKRDIPVPLVAKYHHPEESPKEADTKDENKPEKQEEKTKREENTDIVQVENLNDKATVQHQPLHAEAPHQHSDGPSSTTELSVVRHKPVPVAELFARPKQEPEH